MVGISDSVDMNVDKLQEIFLTQELNPGVLHCRQILNCLNHQESPSFGRRTITNLDSILKSRDITLPIKL